MRRVYQVTGLLFLGAALFVGAASMELTYYTRIGPGPGFFPLWLCTILAVLSLGMLLQATLGQTEPLPPDFFASAKSYWHNAVVLLGLIATALLMNYLGFIITMFFFYLLLLSTLARRNIVETVILSIVGSFGVYYLLAHLLNRPLPRGLLSF